MKIYRLVGIMIGVLWLPIIIMVGAIILNGALDCGINSDAGIAGSCSIGGTFMANILSYILMGVFMVSLVNMGNPAIGIGVAILIIVTPMYLLFLFIKKYRETDISRKGKKYIFLALAVLFTIIFSIVVLLFIGGRIHAYKYFSNIRSEEIVLVGNLVEKIVNFSKNDIEKDGWHDVDFAVTGLHFKLPVEWSIGHSQGYSDVRFKNDNITYHYEYDQKMKDFLHEDGQSTDVPVSVSIIVLTNDEFKKQEEERKNYFKQFSEVELERAIKQRKKRGDVEKDILVNGREALYISDASLNDIILDINESFANHVVVMRFEIDSNYFETNPELKDIFAGIVNQFYFDENFDVEKLMKQMTLNENAKITSITKKTYEVPEKYRKQLQEIKCSLQEESSRDNVLAAQHSISNNDLANAKQHFQWANDKNIKHKEMISVIYQDMIKAHKHNSEKLIQFLDEGKNDSILELSRKSSHLKFIFYKIASGEKDISDITDREWRDMKEDLTQTTILSAVSCD